MNTAKKRATPAAASRGRGVTAACRPFKPGGGGSNPSGPTGASLERLSQPLDRLVAQRQSARLITERWRFESFQADSRSRT